MEIRIIIFYLLSIFSSGFRGEVFNIGFLSGNRKRDGTPDVLLAGLRTSPAIQVAIDEVNRDEILPNGHTLNFSMAETFGEEAESILQVAKLWHNKVDAFIGPQETCFHEAKLAASLNLPMISHFCSHSRPSDKALFPTFARTKPPANFVSKSLTSLLLHFNWTNVALFSSVVNGKDVTEAVQTHFDEHDIKVLHQRSLDDYCYFGLNEDSVFRNWVMETYTTVRIYVILGESDCHLSLLHAMAEMNLFDKTFDEYFVVGVNTNVYNKSEPENYLHGYLASEYEKTDPLVLKGVRNYMGIMASPFEGKATQEFVESVQKAYLKPPFDDFLRHSETAGLIVLRYEAAYLYDAVKLYAQALRDQLLENKDPRNGTEIMQRLFNKSYTSAMGYEMFMDSNGDAQGNYSIISFDTVKNISGLFLMGNFAQHKLNKLPKLTLLKNFTWPNNKVPKDVPFCGFQGEYCLQDYSDRDMIMAFSGGIIVVLAVVLILAYRNFKYEQELDSLLWKIEASDLHEDEFTPTVNVSKHSQMSLNSHDDFKYSVIFTRVGFYKGRIYAIKKFPSEFKVDLTRQLKKELKNLRDLKHDNVNGFIGACVDPGNLFTVNEYCTRGSLKDILSNDEINLDDMFVASLVFDIIRGMIYLHDSPISFHGNLKTTNCLVDSRWVLKLSDFDHGLFQSEWPNLLNIVYYATNDETSLNYLYRAPELLRSDVGFSEFDVVSLQKADTYSFAIILYQLMSNAKAFGWPCLTANQIILKLVEQNSASPLRPNLDLLPENASWLKNLLQDAWSEIPMERPDFKVIRARCRPLRKGMRSNIFDNMLAMMEKYADNLESLVDDRTHLLIEEKKKTDTLLYEMLPKPVAEQLKQGKPVEAESFDCVTIFFSDIVGFTELCASSTPLEVVDFLNDLYTCFDECLEHYDVYKVETIGDAYMVASGVPLRNGDQHAGEIASFAIEVLESINRFPIRHRPKSSLQLRIGIHSGPVCSGVVGRRMPRFCLFGDTVNTAARMESTGHPLKIHCSQSCKKLLDKLGGYQLKERGVIKVKGKGSMTTSWLIGQDLTPAKIRALNKRSSLLSQKSFTSSYQDLELFKSHPLQSSRRGSCRRSGSHLEQLSPGIKRMGKALPPGLNGHFAASPVKPLAKIDPFSKSNNVYLAIPSTQSSIGGAKCSPVSPCSSVHSRISASLTEAEGQQQSWQKEENDEKIVDKHEAADDEVFLEKNPLLTPA